MGYQRLALDLQQNFYVSLPLTEQAIIELHSMCMLEGFHAITVPDLAAGRSMMNTLLSSLNYYDAVAALTIRDDKALPENVADLFQLMEGNLRSRLSDSETIEKYFLEDFNFDFLWIEVCQELVGTPWYSSILGVIQKFNIHNEIPIFIISYEEK